MAAEALSNYALKAYAIELDLNAYKIALENAKNIDTNLKVIHANTFEILPKLIEDSKEDIILYLDPPFDIREGFSEFMKKFYNFLEKLKLDALFCIVLEHNSKIKTPDNIAKFYQNKRKKFGSTSLSFYQKIF